MRDFGAKLVTDCKHEIIKHFATKDIDEVAEHILSVASNDFLDECLEKRLLTIEAKPLIQALARAERLGYEPSDIVEEGASERVIPSTSSGPQVAAGLSYPQQQQQQPKPQLPHPSSHTPGGRLQCLKCYRVFSHPSAYEYVSYPELRPPTPLSPKNPQSLDRGWLKLTCSISILPRMSAAEPLPLLKDSDLLASIVGKASQLLLACNT